MAELLAGLGSAVSGAAAGGATGIMGGLGQLLGSSIMGDANKDTNGAAGGLLQNLYPQQNQGVTANMPSANPSGTSVPAPQPTSYMSGYNQGQTPANQPQPMQPQGGFGALVAHLLGH